MKTDIVAALMITLGIASATSCNDTPNSGTPAAPDGSELAQLHESAGPLFRFKSIGPFADLFFQSVNRLGFLQVSRGGLPSEPQTFLFYSVQECDEFFVCSEVESGSGLIPNSDLTGDADELSLNTDTSAEGNPDFFRFIGDGGLIALDWQATSGFQFSSVGSSRLEFATFVSLSHFNFKASNASISGTILGLAIDPLNASGTIGTNHSTGLDIERKK